MSATSGVSATKSGTAYRGGVPGSPVITSSISEGCCGAAGDGAADLVVVDGTNGNDVINVAGAGTSVSVLGLAARTNITNSEGANDSLVVNALGGDDGVTGLTLDLTGRGMGMRSNRYSMLVKDGVVKSLNVEAPGKFEVSDADTLLRQAKELG